MHSRGDLSYDRGYEWWLMSEAKKRNPNIITYALSRDVPAWVGNGSFFSQDNIEYQTNFLAGAKSHYGITVDFMVRSISALHIAVKV